MNARAVEFFALAQRDRGRVFRAIPGGDAEEVCLHAQQAVEKLLKAVILRFGILPERSMKTHGIRRLLVVLDLAGVRLPPNNLLGDIESLVVCAVDARYHLAVKAPLRIYEYLPVVDDVITWAVRVVVVPSEDVLGEDQR